MSGKSSSRVQRSCESGRRIWESSQPPLKKKQGTQRVKNSCVHAKVKMSAPYFNRSLHASLTLGAGVPSPPEVTVAAGASAFVIAEAEAVRGAHGVVAGQVVHTRYLAFPGGHGRGGGGGGQSGAKVEQKGKTDEEV